MSITVRHQLVIVAYDSSDADERLKHYQREAEAVTKVVETAFDHEESGSFSVAAGGGTYTLPLGAMTTGKMLYIEASADLEVRLDGEGSGHQLKAKATGVRRKLFLSSEFTSAPVLVNAGTAAVEGSFFIAGDA